MGDEINETFNTLSLSVCKLTAETSQLTLSGEIDYSAYEELQDLIIDLFDPCTMRVVVNVEDLSFMDSSGIKLIDILTKHFGFSNTVIYKANEDFRRIIKLVALDHRLNLIANEQELSNWLNPLKKSA